MNEDTQNNQPVPSPVPLKGTTMDIQKPKSSSWKNIPQKQTPPPPELDVTPPQHNIEVIQENIATNTVPKIDENDSAVAVTTQPSEPKNLPTEPRVSASAIPPEIQLSPDQLNNDTDFQVAPIDAPIVEPHETVLPHVDDVTDTVLDDIAPTVASEANIQKTNVSKPNQLPKDESPKSATRNPFAIPINPHAQKNRSISRLLIIIVPIIIGSALVGLTIYTYTHKQPPAATLVTQQNSSVISSPSSAISEINSASKAIATDLQSLNDTKDFVTADLTDSSLGF